MTALPSVLQIALRLLECGVSVIPIKTDGTRAPLIPTGPLFEKFPSWKPFQKERMTPEQARIAFAGDVGIAIVSGAVSENAEAVDIESRAPIHQIAQAIEEACPGLLARIPRIKTPSGGRHLIYRCPVISNSQVLAMVLVDGKPKISIETKGEGGVFTTIGSPGRCHPAGIEYELLNGSLQAIPTITPEERDIILTCCRSFNTYVKPAAMTTAKKAPIQPIGAETKRPGDDYNVRGDGLQLLLDAGWTIGRRVGDSLHLRKPGKTKPGISATYGHVAPGVLFVFSSSAPPFEFERGYDTFGIYCALFHNGDASAAARQLSKDGYGERIPQTRQAKPIGNPAAEHIPFQPSVESPEPSTEQVKAVLAAIEDAVTPPPSPINIQARWLEYGLTMTDRGPLTNLSNAVRVLEGDPSLKSLLWHDTFLQKTMTQPNGHVREWTDADEIHLTLYMQRNLEMHRIGIDAVSQACTEMAMRHVRHNVRDWFATLPAWDGIDRVDRFFEDHFGAEASTYTARCSRNFWLMLVARVMIPGCQVDNMIVLEGGQGIGKSRALRVIGGPWFTQQHENITSKAFFEVLQGKLLIEIGEMDAFTRADITRVKDVISAPHDRYREPYMRRAQDHLRQCIFVGTTNRDDWNKDETGARRFWPIACHGFIDVEAIAAALQQLYAEAIVIFNRVPITASAFEREAADADWWRTDKATIEKQTERLQQDPWQEYIERHIESEKLGDTFVPRSTPLRQLRLQEILEDVLKIEIPRITRVDERRVGAILTAMSWKKKVMRVDGKLKKVWVYADTE